jgi:hypothetical protein
MTVQCRIARPMGPPPLPLPLQRAVRAATTLGGIRVYRSLLLCSAEMLMTCRRHASVTSCGANHGMARDMERMAATTHCSPAAQRGLSECTSSFSDTTTLKHLPLPFLPFLQSSLTALPHSPRTLRAPSHTLPRTSSLPSSPPLSLAVFFPRPHSYPRGQVAS